MRSGLETTGSDLAGLVFWVANFDTATLLKTGRLMKFAYSYDYSYSYGETFFEGPTSPHDVLLESFCADSYSRAGGYRGKRAVLCEVTDQSHQSRAR